MRYTMDTAEQLLDRIFYQDDNNPERLLINLIGYFCMIGMNSKKVAESINRIGIFVSVEKEFVEMVKKARVDGNTFNGYGMYFEVVNPKLN